MHKRYISLVLCVLLSAFLVTGCGSNTTKDRTLVFSHWDIENQQVYENLAQEYMKKHAGLTIEVQAVAAEDYTDTWLKSVSDKTEADVVAVPTGDDFQKFVDSGKLKDLRKSDILPENYDSALTQIAIRDGHTWAVPITGSVPVVFFNQAFFKQYKMVAPQTISDFIVNCSVLQENGVVPFAMSTDDDGLYDTADLLEGIMANGPRDTPLLSDGQFFDENTELDAGFIDAVGLAYELTMSDLLVAKEGSAQGHAALLEQFAQGAYVMIPGDTNDIKKLRGLDGNFSFGFFPMPGSSTSFAGVFKADMMLGISKNSKVDADAEAFIKYLLLAENQEILCNATLSVPASNDVKLSDGDLASAQATLNSADGKYVSLFQRISNNEKAICLEKLDMVYDGAAENLEVLMQDWVNKLKAIK